jgi:hypothetical protein
MVSDLTRMECLVGPLKTSNVAVENDFHAFFAAAGMQVVSITAAVCDRAALIRATSGFEPMDSLQLAAALVHGATVFLTNDARLISFTGLKNRSAGLKLPSSRTLISSPPHTPARRQSTAPPRAARKS